MIDSAIHLMEITDSTKFNEYIINSSYEKRAHVKTFIECYGPVQEVVVFNSVASIIQGAEDSKQFAFKAVFRTKPYFQLVHGPHAISDKEYYERLMYENPKRVITLIEVALHDTRLFYSLSGDFAVLESWSMGERNMVANELLNMAKLKDSITVSLLEQMYQYAMNR